MPVTTHELDEFTAFTSQRLSRGDQLPSLEECLRMWRTERETQEVVADVQQSLDDCANGRVQPLDEAFDAVRRRLGLAQ